MDKQLIGCLISRYDLLRAGADLSMLTAVPNEARPIVAFCIEFAQAHQSAPNLTDMRWQFRSQPDLVKLAEHLCSLQSDMTSAFVLEKLLVEVKRTRFRETMVEIADNLESERPTYETYVGELREIADLGSTGRAEIPLGQASRWAGAVHRIIHRQRISTGIGQLDTLLHGGLGVGELSFFMAPSGRGKTTILINLMASAILAGHDPLFVSLEMSAPEILERLARRLGVLERKAVAAGEHRVLSYLERQVHFMGANAKIVHVRPHRFSLDDLIELADRHRDTGLVDMLLIDYVDKMQLTRGKREFRFQMRELVERLRDAASEHEYSVVTVSQTNREGLKATVLTGKHIAEAISKYESSDVFFVCLPDEEEGEYSFTALKLRDMGGTGKTVVARFDPTRMLISDDAALIPRPGDRDHMGTSRGDDGDV